MATNIENLTKYELMEPETYETWIFTETDEAGRAKAEIAVLERAKALGFKTQATRILNAVKSDHEKKSQEQRFIKADSMLTEFSVEGDITNLKCGANWKCDDSGIYFLTKREAIFVSNTPLLVLNIIQGQDEKKRLVTIAFREAGEWKKEVVDKKILGDRRQVLNLIDLGVSVTSETARHLINYIEDLLTYNEIPTIKAVSRLGWYRGEFLPFTSKYSSSSAGKFENLDRSITTSGSASEWLDLVREIRKTRALAPRIAVASSLASVLLEPLGAQSFITDFHGMTGGGKTVTLRLAASVWGDSEPGEYLGSFRATAVALETRADYLKNFPMILDDSADAAEHLQSNFKGLIYSLCSSKGMSRSNTGLGASRERTWRLCTITSGEAPLIEGTTAGGALNRILEVPCTSDIFAALDRKGETNGATRVIETIRDNYGWFGEAFIAVISRKDIGELKTRHTEIAKELNRLTGATDKQCKAAAAVILADEVATESCWHDGLALAPFDFAEILQSQQTISEGERAYDFLIGQLEVLKEHFNGAPGRDQYGFFKNYKNFGNCVCINPSELARMLQKDKFSKTVLLNWCREKGLLKCNISKSGKTRNDISVNGHPGKWCVLKIIERDPEFEKIDEKNTPFI